MKGQNIFVHIGQNRLYLEIGLKKRLDSGDDWEIVSNLLVSIQKGIKGFGELGSSLSPTCQTSRSPCVISCLSGDEYLETEFDGAPYEG